MRTHYEPLRTVDAHTLLEVPLPQPGMVIESLLYEGVHILCGAPKTGKSWLALALCCAVAEGKPFWNFPTRPCTVLYLCLEDSFARVQNRLYDITEEGPPNLYMSVLADSLQGGLITQIEEFADQHPDTRLLVIDTLQKIRRVTNDNAYACDYSDISILKELAARRHLCILLIHHLRKESDADPFNTVSGTTGLTGAVDSTFVLRTGDRGSSKATMYCTGRDIEYRQLELEFDKGTHRWQLLHDSVREPERKLSPPTQAVLAYMKQRRHFTGTVSELLAEVFGEQEETVKETPALTASKLSRQLNRDAALLEQMGLTLKALPRKGDRREITLRYDGNDVSDGEPGMSKTLSAPSLPSPVPQQATA